MNIKGTAVKILPQFVRERYQEYYSVWLSNLPPESRQIFENEIYASHWYPMYEAAVLPTQVLGKLFFDSAEECAFRVGYYSGDQALKGVYKIFATITSVNFYIRKAPSVFGTYYDAAYIQAQLIENRKVVLEIGYTDEKENLIYHRIKGWLTALIEITQKGAPVIELQTVKQPDGKFLGKFLIQW